MRSRALVVHIMGACFSSIYSLTVEIKGRGRILHFINLILTQSYRSSVDEGAASHIFDDIESLSSLRKRRVN